jgi:hypothetical protein
MFSLSPRRATAREIFEDREVLLGVDLDDHVSVRVHGVRHKGAPP